MTEATLAKKQGEVVYERGSAGRPEPDHDLWSGRSRDRRDQKMQLDRDDLWTRDPTQHPSFCVPEHPDIPVWRYMSGKRFRWLVEKQRLYMPRIEQLTRNDAREGTMTDAQSEFWKELVENAATPEQKAQHQENFRRMLGFVDMYRGGWFVSCWHQSPSENFAFWRVYGREETACPSCARLAVTSGESVAITTTFDKLEALLPAHIEVGAVRYLNYETEGANLFNMFDFVMHKRHFYKYESEVRAVATALTEPTRDAAMAVDAGTRRAAPPAPGATQLGQRARGVVSLSLRTSRGRGV